MNAYQKEPENNKPGWSARLMPVIHIVMGIAYLLLGGWAISGSLFGLDPIIGKILGVVLVAYGVFRLWRGFRDFRTAGSSGRQTR